MKIKLDENISRHLKPILIREGYDVLTVGRLPKIPSRKSSWHSVVSSHEHGTFGR